MSPKTNELTKSYSGIFGHQVLLRSRKGKTIMILPYPRPSQKPSEKQIAYRRKFVQATRYATNILKDPEMFIAYKAKIRKGITPYNIALRDFLTPPVIRNIDVSGYKGNQGEKIRVAARDDFRLTRVHVQIAGPNGLLIEEGECVLPLSWEPYEYTATIPVPDLSGITIIARAYDLPGNEAIMRMIL
jgi:hypothetical protein